MRKGKLSPRQSAVLGFLMNQEVGLKPARIYTGVAGDNKLFKNNSNISDTLRDLSVKDLVCKTEQAGVFLWKITHLGRGVYSASVDVEQPAVAVDDIIKTPETDNFDIIIRQLEGLRFDYATAIAKARDTKPMFTSEEYEAISLAQSILELTNKGKATILAKMCERYYE